MICDHHGDDRLDPLLVRPTNNTDLLVHLEQSEQMTLT